MPKTKVNNVEIAWEIHGERSDPVIVLIQGLSMPLTATPPEMISQLVEAGYCVLTFDNRDAGQSQLLSEIKPANFAWQFVRKLLHLSVDMPYELDDMMRDTAALMTALDIERAHVIGISMGGMIAQLLAIHHPERVLSLTSIMSTTGRRGLPGPERAVRNHIVKGPAETTPEARLEYQRALWRLLGGPDYPLPNAELEAFLERILKRGMTAQGAARQSLAILGAYSRAPFLHQLSVPTLVIHGEDDPLVNIAGGYDTARCVPGARMVAIPGMGHDLPLALLERINGAVLQHMSVAGSNGRTTRAA